MLDTDSALYDLIVAPVLAAAFHYRPMLDTYSASLDKIATPVLVAAFAFLRTPSTPRTPLLVMPHVSRISS